MFDKQDDSGVSPVIGVILMVAVTVALVALVTVTVFDIGGDVSASPDATVQLEQSGNTLQATVLRNENVDDFTLQASDGSTASLGGNAGDGASLTTGTQSSTETFAVATAGDGTAPFDDGDLLTVNNDIDAINSVNIDTDADGNFDDADRTTDFDETLGNADQAGLTGGSSSISDNGGSSSPEIQIKYDFTAASFDSVSVIANMPDGGSEVLTSTDVE